MPWVVDDNPAPPKKGWVPDTAATPKKSFGATMADAGKSFASGLGEGLDTALGTAGDLAKNAVTDQAKNALTIAGFLTQRNATPLKQAVDTGAAKVMPKTTAALETDRKAAGLDYTPQTTTGQYAHTMGSFAPNALFPGSGAQRAAAVVVPAIASEAAGQATKGSKWETPARIAGAVAGGVGAAGITAGAEALKNASRAAPEKIAAPTLDELTAAKNAAYKAVDESGVTYKPEAFQSLASNIESDLTRARLNPKLHPNAAAMLEDIKGMADNGEAPTLTQLDQLRQVVGRDVASAPSKGERFMGKKMIAQIDDFIAKTGPDHVTGADGPEAAAMLQRARDLNTRVVKIGAITDAGTRAERQAAKTGSGGNYNNATRQQIDRSASKVTNWTPDEQAAIDKVVMGTKTGNFLRRVGKLSPEGNGLMLAGHLAVAVPSHGLSGIAAVGGAAAKLASDAITTNNVRALVELIAQGGEAGAQTQATLAARAAREPAVAMLYRQVMAAAPETLGKATAEARPALPAQQPVMSRPR